MFIKFGTCCLQKRYAKQPFDHYFFFWINNGLTPVDWGVCYFCGCLGNKTSHLKEVIAASNHDFAFCLTGESDA